MLNISLFEKFVTWFDSLNKNDREKISDKLLALQEQNFELLYIKEIKGPIKELRIKKLRILFCVESSTVFILTGFIKKTARTPKSEIRTAQKMYELLLKEINSKK